VQQYAENYSNKNLTWGKFGSTIKKILNAYLKSTPDFIEFTPKGLIHAEKLNMALTWMNSYALGTPVVQRAGLAVEINALWYNAISFALEMAELAGETEFVANWKKVQEKTGQAFMNTFWTDGREHLADVVRNGQADWAIRPNMVIAAGMKYSPLSTEQKKSILSMAKKKLLTKRGLRTLSPDHLRYKGTVEGNQDERESAVHQGAAWPWLMQFFVETYLKIHGRGGLPFVKQLMEVFEEEMTEHCIGTLSEMYDGNPPYKGRGATSVAWNVAGVFYAMNKVQSYKE
jgi:predicted glycogen debranching enzyme